MTAFPHSSHKSAFMRRKVIVPTVVLVCACACVWLGWRALQDTVITYRPPFTLNWETITPSNMTVTVHSHSWAALVEVSKTVVSWVSWTDTSTTTPKVGDFLLLDITTENRTTSVIAPLTCLIMDVNHHYYDASWLYSPTLPREALGPPPGESRRGKLAYEMPPSQAELWLDCDHGIKVRIQ